MSTSIDHGIDPAELTPLHIRPGRLVLGAFVAALGVGVILLELIEEDAWSAAPFAVLVAALAGIGGVVARQRATV